MEPITATLTLGQTAQFIDSKGHVRVALVIGTSESVQAGTSVPTLNPGFYNLMTFTAFGRPSVKLNIPEAALANDDYLVDGKLREVVYALDNFN